jgi:hypothetical protein
VTVDRARRRQLFARWHRRLALVVFLWLGVLAASGLLVNHAHDWGLDRKPLPQSMQSGLYGIEAAGEDFCATTPGVGQECSRVFARLELPSSAFLLTPSSIFLVDEKGVLIERLSPSQLSLGELQAGLLRGSSVFLQDAEHIVRTDRQLLDWKVLDAVPTDLLQDPDWQSSTGSSASISWERFLLDLHAARFLGSWTKAFNDLVAIVILLLVVSGVWLSLNKRNGNNGGDGQGSRPEGQR